MGKNVLTFQVCRVKALVVPARPTSYTKTPITEERLVRQTARGLPHLTHTHTPSLAAGLQCQLWYVSLFKISTYSFGNDDDSGFRDISSTVQSFIIGILVYRSSRVEIICCIFSVTL